MEKPLDAFHSRRSTADGKQYQCKACSSTTSRTRRLRRYGITDAQYDDMLEAQNGTCAICNREPEGKRLAVDHDHTTGAIRGLLCDHCNHVLGKAEDRAEWLRNAADYLDLFAFADV